MATFSRCILQHSRLRANHGTLHTPPPIHQASSKARASLFRSFCPREVLDYHPNAIVVSYNHSNVDLHEIIYYCNDKFGSRKGIEEGSITVHPLGIPHGPQPGAVELVWVRRGRRN